jgi:hypothetical protein
MLPSNNPGDGLPGMPNLRNLVNNSRPEINIHLNSRRKIYSTLDTIEGTVCITPAVDTEFDNVEIDFVGTSRTFVERYTTAAAISGRSEAFHTFLRLTQPKLNEIEEYQQDRTDRMLKAGKTYEFGFLFKVPEHLLEKVCKHTVANQSVRDAHWLLPPSLGDQELSSKDGTLCDMAPEMTSVRYGIFVRITKFEGAESVKSIHVAAKARRIRVVPAVAQAPPLDVKGMLEDNVKTEYCLRKEKKIYKKLWVGNYGTLVMEAAQPEPIELPPVNSELGYSALNTTAIMMLRFEPAKGANEPPPLDKLVSKLKTRTYYSTRARDDFPQKADSEFDASRSMHGHTHDLITHSLGKFPWRVEDPSKRSPSPVRRDSTVSVEEKRWIPGPSSTYTPGAPFWTARLPLPITLPNTRYSFVPTFHSCLISRTYTIALTLSLQNIGQGGPIDLRVPMQIAAKRPIENAQESNSDAARRRESVASATLNTDVDDDDDQMRSIFAPRSPINAANPNLPPAHNESLARSDTRDAPPPGYTDRQSNRQFRSVALAEGIMLETAPPAH